jgi:phosphate transport system permease protein
VLAVTVVATEQLRSGRRIRDWLGDRLLLGATMAAGLGALALIALIAYKVLRGAHLAFSEFGLPFIWHSAWDANKGLFGAAPGLYGTAVTSAIALLIATPLALAIALFLSELAPRGVNTLLSSLVEMLAAIPSVVLGLWGILVPIVASVCRELFLSVPRELEEGALALGATRWEMVRGVVLASSWRGIGAAVILGLGRALGEAIAVTQVIGAGWVIRADLFGPGDTLASRIAGQYQGAVSKLQIASLFYLAAILLLIGLVTNLIAQLIVGRSSIVRKGGS